MLQVDTNTKLFEFENWSTPIRTKSGVFRYAYTYILNNLLKFSLSGSEIWSLVNGGKTFLNLSFKLYKFIYRLFFSFFLLPRDDLWLNEAMAQFLQYKSIDAMYPELDVVRRKLLQNLLSLFKKKN
jgi:hypothetical protein